MRSTNGTFALTRWNSLWEEEFARGGDERVICEGCTYGQGGGIFIALHKSAKSVAISIYLKETNIHENLASIGGAAMHDAEVLE